MFYIVLIALAIFGVFSAAVFGHSRLNDLSLDDAAKEVYQTLKQKLSSAPPEPFFVFDPAIFDAMLNAVCQHSLLPQEVTLAGTEFEVFPIFVAQILPKDANSIERAKSAAATIARNAAVSCGFNPELAVAVFPAADGVYVLKIGVATTAAQKSEMAALKAAQNKNAALSAGSGNAAPVDAELNADLNDLKENDDNGNENPGDAGL